MSIIEIILIAISLSMDAVAVSISNSLIFKKDSFNKYRFIIMAIAFGVFQGLMPLMGYFVGGLFSDFITQYSGIIVCIILGVIGGNMIKESIFSKDDESDICENTLTLKLILLQALATSIDAFAVGVSFCATKVNIIFASTVICIITAILSGIFVTIGSKFGEKLGDKAELFGGVILILIGVKALF